MGFLISLLLDEAMPWANPLWENDKHVVHNFPSFVASFRRVFIVPACYVSTTKLLLSMQKGSRTVAKYAIEFHSRGGWNNEALEATFSHVVSDTLEDKLWSKTCPKSSRLSFSS